MTIAEALIGNPWRTIGGIARDASLEPEDVQRFIDNHPGMFIEHPIKLGGSTIYRLADGAT